MPLITCPECKATYESRPPKCPSCGYPFEIDGEDRAKIVAQQIMQKRSLGQGQSAVKVVRIMLWIIAALSFFVGLYLKYYSQQLFIIQTIATVIYLGLSFLTYILPLVSVILSLVGFFCLYILIPLIVGQPEIILEGLLFKTLILMILAYALVKLLQEERVKKELNQ